MVIRCFSNDGRRCVYNFVGKSGRVWRRSVMRDTHGMLVVVVVGGGDDIMVTLGSKCRGSRRQSFLMRC